jgi:hypothetical protein
MPEKADKSDKAFRELVRVLEEAVEAGADSVELEWEDRDLVVYRFFGNTGLGTVPIPKGLQGAVIRELVKKAGLARKPKGKMRLILLEQEYEVLAKEYDSFGESAFTIKLKKSRKRTK